MQMNKQQLKGEHKRRQTIERNGKKNKGENIRKRLMLRQQKIKRKLMNWQKLLRHEGLKKRQKGRLMKLKQRGK